MIRTVFFGAFDLWPGLIFAVLLGVGVWLYRKLSGPFICRVCGEPAADRCMYCIKAACDKHVEYEFDGYVQLPKCDVCAGRTAKARKAGA